MHGHGPVINWGPNRASAMAVASSHREVAAVEGEAVHYHHHHHHHWEGEATRITTTMENLAKKSISDS